MEGYLKVGVVGFSRNRFDKKTARIILKAYFEELTAQYPDEKIAVISGYTNSGVPKIAYELATELGLYTVGFSAKQSLRVRSGVYPVDKEIIVGKKFGDESSAFIQFIDLLIRVGGGSQSRKEVELFKKQHEAEDLSKILFEKEVEWYGK